MTQDLREKSILLVITGGIAAYKALELIRLLRKAGANVRAILTKGGAQFVTPLSVSALCEHEAYTDLWFLKEETEMGHIRLTREADLIVVAPASADFLAKMAHGLADDLASAALLAADKPILAAPAMNHKMWENAATQSNIEKLQARGIEFIGPEEGDMACGEYGMGRMAEPEEIAATIEHFFLPGKLEGLNALVTAGPTFEPIDPVRFIGNRSSGKQGYAIAAALAKEGAKVLLISGPVSLPKPKGVQITYAETAKDMLVLCENSLPADLAVCAAAVGDWAPERTGSKIKKGKKPPEIILKENPDILKTLSAHKKRPKLVIGFAAETENLMKNAEAKLMAKNCDWIIANDVSQNVFGAAENHVFLVRRNGNTEWPRAGKDEIARRLTGEIMAYFEK